MEENEGLIEFDKLFEDETNNFKDEIEFSDDETNEFLNEFDDILDAI
jgi:hypothetical protein